MTIHDFRAFNLFRLIPSLCVLVICAGILCFRTASAWSDEGSHLLDGRSYIGKNGEIGKKLAEYEDEEIVFKDGMFTSVSCVPYNFASAPYHAELIGDEIHFVAVTHSPTHGQISWRGVIDGDQADVTFVWTKERWYWDIRREYWFKGQLRQ